MNALDVLRGVSDALVIAGPLIERFGLKDSDLANSIVEGARDLIDAAEAAINGAEQFGPEIDQLIEEFRGLRGADGLTQADFERLAVRIKDKTAALRDVVNANRN
ncbi:MAG: hypothetical protein CMB99_16565 [Flavobacteriaceae bacterium]|jgi:hypothetical protein|nr:hypothetical protein [Flavobacteriaceae bacterium]|tara:strand:+ start:1720 stop:2034 length:315 start_codon:yes stop_codon:yes gene_type:complete